MTQLCGYEPPPHVTRYDDRHTSVTTTMDPGPSSTPLVNSDAESFEGKISAEELQGCWGCLFCPAFGTIERRQGGKTRAAAHFEQHELPSPLRPEGGAASTANMIPWSLLLSYCTYRVMKKRAKMA